MIFSVIVEIDDNKITLDKWLAMDWESAMFFETENVSIEYLGKDKISYALIFMVVDDWKIMDFRILDNKDWIKLTRDLFLITSKDG